MTRISIITVARNAEGTIAQTIESVLHQTVLPYEYLIKDGNSTDDTVLIAQGYREAFEKAGISYRILTGEDKGIYDAMNTGIDAAGGDLIGILNADDWYEPVALECVCRAYEEEPFDLFFADLRMHRDEKHCFIKHARDRKYATSRDWNHPTTFITKEMYGRYRYKNDTIHDDYDLILRMKKDHVRVRVCNEVLANFRMNGMSHKRSIRDALSRASIKYGIYRQNGYSRFYLLECYGVELAKLVIG
ncbi:MAG: glycosyltransferase [Lachnospiraceae bacterium]|nr:glycosyltransferase [Lachnospiraceae bacterium]